MLFLFYLVSCDGYVAIQGNIFEIDNTSNYRSSYAIIDSINDNDNKESKPIINADIRVLSVKRINKIESPNPYYVLRMDSDSLGRFNGGKVYAPGWYSLYLRAYKKGYLPLEQKFKHNKFNHFANIYLIKDTLNISDN